MKSFKALFLMILVSLLIISINAYAERTQAGPVNAQRMDGKLQRITDIGEKFEIKPTEKWPGLKSSADVRQGGEDIASATVISSIPATLTGTTSGYNDDYEVSSGGDCTHTGAPDVVYSFTPDMDYRLHIISCNSSYWTKLFVYETDETTVLACSQFSDSCLPDYRAALYGLDMYEGITYYIVIDGGVGGQSGDYEVTIDPLPPTDFLTIHPGLGDNGQGLLALTYQEIEYDSLVIWTNSGDNGTTWSGGVYFDLGSNPSYPSLDYWGDEITFYGTFVPATNWFNGKPTVLVRMYDINDPSTYSVGYWDWTIPLHDMVMADIACDNSNEEWNFGWMSIIQDYDIYDNISLYSFPYSETGEVIGGWITEGGQGTACDIDLSTHRGYAVWDYFDDDSLRQSILVQQESSWYWWDTTTGWNGAWGFVPEAGNSYQYPAVASYNANILVVYETYEDASPSDVDIICMYSEGNESVEFMSRTSVVTGTAEAERYPEIQHISGTNFLVTYLQNTELYAVLTEDAGATWGTPAVISEVGDVVVNEYRAADIAESDGYAVKIMYQYEDPGRQGDISLRLITHQVYPYPDTDGDGIPDHLDNCPTVYNDDQLDNDGDLHGDACDNCDFVYNPDQANDDADSLGNACDNCPTADNDDQANGDGDMHGDACDNCPQVANNDQANSDADSHGDVCDNCPTTDNEDQANSDTDTHGDACDNCPNDDNEDQQNSDTDSHGDVCDNCPLVDNEDQADENQNGVGDACDWICGDANSDGAVNLLDITFLIAYKYKNGPEPEFLVACDVNGSGTPEAPEVNLLDITYLIAFKYKEGPEPNCP